ncbi:MAG: hypothetical protein IJ521_07620 [Schwartzia sp.]|nr:hypothetical protein [Schwartzia sp. (in: firmicutes)]
MAAYRRRKTIHYGDGRGNLQAGFALGIVDPAGQAPGISRCIGGGNNTKKCQTAHGPTWTTVAQNVRILHATKKYLQYFDKDDPIE